MGPAIFMNDASPSAFALMSKQGVWNWAGCGWTVRDLNQVSEVDAFEIQSAGRWRRTVAAASIAAGFV
jgi:hypothetical protein